MELISDVAFVQIVDCSICDLCRKCRTRRRAESRQGCEEAAEWIATALSSSGYKADPTLQSFKEIDRFVDDQTQNGRPRPGGLLAEDFGARVFALGAYVGEVIRRLGEGQWYGNDNDRDAEINIQVRLKSAGKIWPMQRVIKRITNGREDGIYAYGYIILKDERRPPNAETSPPGGR
jgi:hypothetical protein